MSTKKTCDGGFNISIIPRLKDTDTWIVKISILNIPCDDKNCQNNMDSFKQTLIHVLKTIADTSYNLLYIFATPQSIQQLKSFEKHEIIFDKPPFATKCAIVIPRKQKFIPIIKPAAIRRANQKNTTIDFFKNLEDATKFLA